MNERLADVDIKSIRVDDRSAIADLGRGEAAHVRGTARAGCERTAIEVKRAGATAATNTWRCKRAAVEVIRARASRLPSDDHRAARIVPSAARLVNRAGSVAANPGAARIAHSTARKVPGATAPAHTGKTAAENEETISRMTGGDASTALVHDATGGRGNGICRANKDAAGGGDTKRCRILKIECS